MTVTSTPKPCKKPAVYNEMYDAPTINVLPGAFSSLKTSSDVIEYYLAPGISGYVGLPPVAINIFYALISYLLPFLSVSSIVLGAMTFASLL